MLVGKLFGLTAEEGARRDEVFRKLTQSRNGGKPKAEAGEVRASDAPGGAVIFVAPMGRPSTLK